MARSHHLPRAVICLASLCFLFYSLFQVGNAADTCPIGDALTEQKCANDCARIGDPPRCPRPGIPPPRCDDTFFNEAICCRKSRSVIEPIDCRDGPKNACICIKGKVKGKSIAIVAGIVAIAVLIIFAVAYVLFRKRTGGRIRRSDEARIRLEEQARLEALKMNSMNGGNPTPATYDPNDRKSNTQPPPGYPSKSSSANPSTAPSPPPSYSPSLSHTPPANASAPEGYMVYPEQHANPAGQPPPPGPPLHIPGSEGMYPQHYESPPPMYNSAPIHGYSVGYDVGPPPPPPTVPSEYSTSSTPYSDVYYNSGPPR